MAVNIPVIKSISGSKSLGLNGVPLFNGPEGASQTYKRGAPLIYTSGYLVVAGSAPIDTGDVVVGFATQDGRNGTAGQYTATYVPVIPSAIFTGVLSNKSTSSHTLVQTNLGVAYALDVDATSLAWYIDVNNTTNPVCRIVGFQDPVGTVDAVVFFMYLAAGTLYK